MWITKNRTIYCKTYSYNSNIFNGFEVRGGEGMKKGSIVAGYCNKGANMSSCICCSLLIAINFCFHA